MSYPAHANCYQTVPGLRRRVTSKKAIAHRMANEPYAHGFRQDYRRHLDINKTWPLGPIGVLNPWLR